ncbi:MULTISPECIES: ATP-binding protein [Moorena]|uniref:ATPase n=1 Tax=Moorena producens 3L TaxID=489825 RepID=F4XSQ6_9CYAN|nr:MULTISPECIES: ATP-binding protein [Moorena]EGJ32381.1 ATPase [Moorena producens 3L]NEP68583.1 ATP-binding protein [Moorena sp. SIO3A5]NEQ15442.1 ATP-binding protein [Moorena sp. SIO3E2]OLT64378.1 ATPase [Moorena producens 3L]
MSEADKLWDETDEIFTSWNLKDIPFSESASSLVSNLDQVFTGRTQELKTIFHLLRGRERKRILVYGSVGIGKTAFILEVLSVLQRKSKDTLATYISLPFETDLATAALIALARHMPEDEWAQQLLNNMGLMSESTRKTKTKFDVKIPMVGGSIETESKPVNAPKFPTLTFQDLLERALEKYSRVVIAIDDLDKQDPAKVRQLLHDAQGMLKGDAWFILTGHPSGLTRDLLISERGLFDLALEIKALDQPTTYQMLINYLASARINKTSKDETNPDAVHPFTLETARNLCAHSQGIPRWFNRIGNYVLLKAADLQAEKITPEVFQQGLEYVSQKLRGQSELTPEDYYVLDLVLEKGVLSDENVTMDDLKRLKAQQFTQVLPILDKLIQFDLVRRLPTDKAAEYQGNPLLLPPSEQSDEEE